MHHIWGSITPESVTLLTSEVEFWIGMNNLRSPVKTFSLQVKLLLCLFFSCCSRGCLRKVSPWTSFRYWLWSQTSVPSFYSLLKKGKEDRKKEKKGGGKNKRKIYVRKRTLWCLSSKENNEQCSLWCGLTSNWKVRSLYNTHWTLYPLDADPSWELNHSILTTTPQLRLMFVNVLYQKISMLNRRTIQSDQIQIHLLSYLEQTLRMTDRLLTLFTHG